MTRREFMALLGGAAAAWPLAARAQQPAMPVIGFLHPASPESYADRAHAFVQGLSEIGYVENHNVAIEYRSAGGQNNRLPGLAADLARREVKVIAAMGGPSALAAKAATSTIPIVFSIGLDPVKIGLVTRLDRPDGNITGVSYFSQELGIKRFALLHLLVPNAAVIGMLVNSTFPDAEIEVKNVEAAARSLGHQLFVVNATSNPEIDAAFASLVERHAAALLVGNDVLSISRRDHIIGLATRYRLPTIYFVRDFAEAGGLMSYAPSVIDAYRQAGVYTGRILKGEKKLADLPVMLPTRFEFVINLKAAKALGLTLPPELLAIADEVIE